MYCSGTFYDTDLAYAHGCELMEQVLLNIHERHHFVIETAFREIMGNAVNAAKKHNGRITVHFFLTNEALLCTVANSNCHFYTEPDKHRLPGDTNEHGRGIPLIVQCTDSVSYRKEDRNATVVTAYWSMYARRNV